MKNTITTIIPTFRRPQLLEKAILSVLNQSYPHLRVCVYDNASGDETEAIVRNLMKKDSRITYYRHAENIGMMANYQFALSKVDTPFFCLLSDDDFFLPFFFETALKGFEQYPSAVFSACGVKAIDEDGKLISDPMNLWEGEGYFSPCEGLEDMIERPLLPVGIVFNSELIKKVEINCDKEIQIRWDTDYLLQIISQFPYVINKKICAVFLSHSQGYSTSCYRQQQNSLEKLNRHLVATERMKNRLLKRLRFSFKCKSRVRKTFSRVYKRDLVSHIVLLSTSNILKDGPGLLKAYRKVVGVDRLFLRHYAKVWIYKNAIWALPWICQFLSYVRRIQNKVFKGVE